MAGWRPVKSQASVAPGLKCAAQSMRVTAARNSSASAASNCATSRNTRLATRDHRHVRYAVSSEPVNATSPERSRLSAAPQRIISCASRSPKPRGALARNFKGAALTPRYGPGGHSRQFDPGRLEFRVLLERVQGLVAAHAGLLEATEWHGDVIGVVTVDEHG